MEVRLIYWFSQKSGDVRIFAGIRIDGVPDGAEHDDARILRDMVAFNGPSQLRSIHSRHLHIDNGKSVRIFIRNCLAEELKGFFRAGR